MVVVLTDVQKGCQHWNLVGDGEVDGKWPPDFILNENGYEWGVLRSADGLCLTTEGSDCPCGDLEQGKHGELAE